MRPIDIGLLRRLAAPARHSHCRQRLSHPAGTVRYFLYATVAYLIAGVAWVISFYRRKPDALGGVQTDLDFAHASHQPV